MKQRLVKRIWLLLALVLLLAALVSGSIAAFTNQGYRKGVATVRSTESMFSSNRLSAYKEGETLQSYTLSYTKTEPAPPSVAATININNTSKDHPSQANPEDVKYTLTVTIEPLNHATLTDGYTISCNGSAVAGLLNTDGTACSYTSTLLGEELSTDSWQLTIPYADLGKNKITITAVPAPGCVAGDQAIGGVFYTMLREEGQQDTFSWNASGILLDKTATAADSQNFSAFNFEITGNGKGTGTLVWNPAYLELDKYFLESSGLTPSPVTVDGQAWNQLTLDLDSSDTSYYLLQFYRAAPIDPDETWDTIAKKVLEAGGDYTATGYIRFTAEKVESITAP